MDSLIKIGGAPITKLIEVISNGIGKLYEPAHLILMARAEAKAEHIKYFAEAKRDALLVKDEGLFNHLSAIETRLLTKESKRQQNINNVLCHAINVISSENEVSSDKVDQDWITRFFDIVQDISEEDMQQLWGRILAGEVKQPKSFSLRTLELLRNMTRYEAELFEKIASYVFYSDRCYLYRGLLNEVFEDLKYGAIIHLMEIGLIQSVSDSGIELEPLKDGNQYPPFIYGDFVYHFSIPEHITKIGIPVYPLSSMGCEIFKLVRTEPNYEYFNSVIKEIIAIYPGLKIYRTKILSNDNHCLRYNDDDLEEVN